MLKRYCFRFFLVFSMLLGSAGSAAADMLDYYTMGILPSLAVGTITTATGKVWMDRNLGATRRCTKPRSAFANDAEYIASQGACFGDYYQWGRPADGHQKSDSPTTGSQAASITPEHGSFILDPTFDYEEDWALNADGDGSQRQSSWNPCPSGFRLPTIDEVEDENISNSDDAFSKLKFPLTGNREHNNGALNYRGNSGTLWSSTSHGSNSAWYLYFGPDSTITNYYYRASGFSVRCLKE